MDKSLDSNKTQVNRTGKSNDQRIHNLLDLLDSNMVQSNEIHKALLDNEQSALKVASVGIDTGEFPHHHTSSKKIVFTKEQLCEFGTGSIARCFGDDYMILDSRRSPRIPNGDLLMIDYITEISGEKMNLNPPAAVTAEYKVRPEAWFLQENNYPGLSLSMLMEIALQPCGILSAYLGTSLILPPENNIFRNLDGQIRFIGQPNLAGKTIVNKSILQDAFTSGGMHIQKYAFSLSVDGTNFIEGESTFGYFSESAMAKQAGLGKPAIQSIGKPSTNLINRQNHQKGHFNLSDSIALVSPSSPSEKTVILGEKRLSPDEWFYTNHFFQDPVMPGSLGAEAIMQGLWAYISRQDLFQRLNHPVLSFSSSGSTFTWKYRGQVTPKNKRIQFLAEIQQEISTASEATMLADADFLVDDLHIYSFNNLALSIREG